MKKHAEFLRPKFDIVLNTLEAQLAPVGIGEWVAPRGGYFVSLNLLDGTAKRAFELTKALGVTLTPVGATFPYGNDPRDSNLRIAPTYPSNKNLQQAIDILCLCAKIAAIEKFQGA
ncbi:MAG: aminotransferase, partial [Oscillospiraceae bacterium]|nr:aminotransferase [Oscillospiraceae bacterium]